MRDAILVAAAVITMPLLAGCAPTSSPDASSRPSAVRSPDDRAYHFRVIQVIGGGASDAMLVKDLSHNDDFYWIFNYPTGGATDNSEVNIAKHDLKESSGARRFESGRSIKEMIYTGPGAVADRPPPYPNGDVRP